MRQYELYLVIDADAEEEDVNATVEKMTQAISAGDGKTSGELTKVEARGKRRLAFPLKRKVVGQDFILYFQTEPQALTEMERLLKLDERVLRYLIVRTGED